MTTAPIDDYVFLPLYEGTTVIQTKDLLGGKAIRGRGQTASLTTRYPCSRPPNREGTS